MVSLTYVSINAKIYVVLERNSLKAVHINPSLSLLTITTKETLL